jgi:hypothetical protein
MSRIAGTIGSASEQLLVHFPRGLLLGRQSSFSQNVNAAKSELSYGHVAIIASVGTDTLQIAQQNPGPFGSSREDLGLTQREGHWYIEQARALGWLRLPPAEELPAPEQSYSQNQ